SSEVSGALERRGREAAEKSSRRLLEWVLEVVEELGQDQPEKGTDSEALGDLGDEQGLMLVREHTELTPHALMFELPHEPLAVAAEVHDELGVAVVALGVGQVLDLALPVDGERRDKSIVELLLREDVRDVFPEVGCCLHEEDRAVVAALLALELDVFEEHCHALARVGNHETSNRSEIALGDPDGMASLREVEANEERLAREE